MSFDSTRDILNNFPEPLKARLIAARLSHEQFLHLRNTVRILRKSGAPLGPEEEKRVQEFAAVVQAYEEMRLHPFTDEQMVAIWKEVSNGRGNHGDFLRSFGQAVIRADHENLPILREAALSLIEKYQLHSYLEEPHAK